MKTQVEKLLDHLIAHGEITGLQCINDLGILNYKGRICDLRKLGYDIKTEYITKTNAQGEKKTFALYTLKV